MAKYPKLEKKLINLNMKKKGISIPVGKQMGGLNLLSLKKKMRGHK